MRRVYPGPLCLTVLLLVAGCGEDATSPMAPEASLAATTHDGLSFLQISAGDVHTCGVTADNRAYCWGSGFHGALGNGSPDNHSRPVAVSGTLRFVRVSAGLNYTCGVTTDNRAYCWGENTWGKLGDGSTTQRMRPVAVAGGHRFRYVDAGGSHTCGITTVNTVYCWGYNRWGQLGDGSSFVRRLRPVPLADSHRYQTVAAGERHTCGVTMVRRAYCWGLGADGRIGDGKTLQRHTPVRVTSAGGFNVLQLDAGDKHTCSAIADPDFRAFCWGDNSLGQIGDGTTTDRVSSTPVAGGLSFKGVSTGTEYSCGLVQDGQAYCWGFGYYGQLGTGETGDGANRLTPAAVSGGLIFASVTSGRTHSCALTAEGKAYCWGGNTAGQVGDGDPSFSRPEPTAVVAPA